MIRYALALFLMAIPAQAQDAGLEAWNKVFQVFSHPRCANCHVGPDSLPMWSDANAKARPHGMHISGGASRTDGAIRTGAEQIICTSCHTQRNSPAQHGPPGAQEPPDAPDPRKARWALPPASMQWFDKSSREICAQVKDRERNGNLSIPEVIKHIEHDPLVHWGWTPGPGREPAPYSISELARFLKEWDAAGAPCPKE